MNKTLCLIAALCCAGAAGGQEWRYHSGDARSSKYAPLGQIDGGNFAGLAEVWRYDSPDRAIAERTGYWTDENKNTPLVVDGVLYYSTPYNVLCALDAATGEELWTFDPESWKDYEGFTGAARGIAYWEDGDHKRIFFGTFTDRLYAVDIATGRPDPAFGTGGFVDLGKGLRRRIDRHRYCITSPPVVCRGVVVVGSGITDWHDRPPAKYSNVGDVRGFDAKTGELLWTFHTVPQEGEAGNETWENDAWRTYGQANVWASMTADQELGYVYLPVSSTSHNHYGGERPGANLFSNSLVCLRAETGARVWHYQFVRHGLWNYDPAAAPVLADIEVDGQPIKAIAQVTKQAFCYVLDRTTGQPVWPIKERKVPRSRTPGEKSWPKQPMPGKPAPYDRQGVSEDDLIDFTPELRRRALAVLEKYEHGPLFTPPSEKGTIVLPGGLGGSDWSGAALVPGSNVLYVPSRTDPDLIRLEQVEGMRLFSDYASHVPGADDWGGHFDGLPLTKPPYGRITAIDLDSGEHVWMKPVGRGPVNHPALKGLDLPDLGWHQYNFVIATETVLVVASQKAEWWGWAGRDSFVEKGPYLRAYDLDSGELLAAMELPGNPNGSPISYMAGGRQYIVFPCNDGDWYPVLVAMALPE